VLKNRKKLAHRKTKKKYNSSVFPRVLPLKACNSAGADVNHLFRPTTTVMHSTQEYTKKQQTNIQCKIWYNREQ